MKEKLSGPLGNILLVFGSILITLALIEFGVRLFFAPQPVLELGEIIPWDEGYTYSPEPDQYGFREEAFTEQIFGDDYERILMLGDSFTYGHGVENGADRFSDIVEKELNRSLSKQSELNYHIYNAGISGTEPKDWTKYLDQLLPVYQPEHVITVFFLRDGTDLCTSLACYEDEIAEIKGKYESNILLNNTALGQLYLNQRVQNDFTSWYVQRLKAAYLGSEEETATWEMQQAFLVEMQEKSRAQGLEMHLVLFPVLYNLESDYPFEDIEAEIMRFADEIDLETFSLTPGFLGHDSHTLWVSQSDQHPNEQGHQIAAERLLPFVQKVLDDR